MVKPLAVVNEEDIAEDDEAALVCMTTQELPEPLANATKGHCAECGVELWVANSSPKTPTKLCFPCARDLVKEQTAKGEEVTLAVTEKQLRDVKRKML